MTNDELAREIARYVDEAIRRNRRTETVIVAVLTLIAAAGTGTLVVGAMLRQGMIAPPGAFRNLAIVLSIRELVRLRRENISLSTLPHLVRMADREAGRKFVEELARTLIKRFDT